MSAVASKNLYELLGNDHDQDSDKEPEPPVKVVDKTPARTTKRNAPGEAPAAKAGTGPSTRRGGFSGNEGAFRDRAAGSASNRGKTTDERRGSDRGRARGGRGATRRDGRDDRHSKTGTQDSEKQTAQGWGSVEGGAEYADERAGEEIAKDERAEANGEDAADLEPEPKDNSISYTDYLAQLAEKKLSLGSNLPAARKPNDGKEDKKWAGAKPIEREEDEDFIAGSGGKAKRERERKQKQVVEIDHGFIEQPDRGGRGGARGGRGRAEGGRGGRGRGDAGRGRGRGTGEFRGGRGGPKSTINTSDKNAFPSLGA